MALAGKIVVVTGASGGVGRATVRELAARGATVALIARGSAGLEKAMAEIESGHAYSADVSDHAEVRQVAEQIEHDLGPIDIWINVAFSSLLAPFWEIRPEEFERATRVTYLGYVWGTRAALELMRPRGRGVIVQAGSALTYRAIPLQSAYCGAKHAIKGFTESVRTELMNDKSDIKITMVQLPALNTPQFDWVLSRLRRHPQPVAPIYQPEVAAQALVYAAEHPERREYWVGASTAATIIGQKFAAGLLDRYLGRTGVNSQQMPDQPPTGMANLWEPADEDHSFGAHGSFDDRSVGHSPQVWLSQHRRLVLTGGAAAATTILWRALR